jgi:phage replication-related protein YjqB (UPF0714/DUF867 family)
MAYDPETYMPSVEPREIELLREALKECSDDLAELVKSQYPTPIHPSQQRRYDRDMEPVLRARDLLASCHGYDSAEKSGKPLTP